MENKTVTFEELAEIYNLDYKKNSWYNWFQHKEKTLKEEFGIFLNTNINSKEVEVYTKYGTFVETHELKSLIKKEKEDNGDVIQISPKGEEPVKVIVDSFKNYEYMSKMKVGLYSKRRPWLSNDKHQTTKGVKVLVDGIPRSSEKTNFKITGAKCIFTPNTLKNIIADWIKMQEF